MKAYVWKDINHPNTIFSIFKSTTLPLGHLVHLFNRLS